MTLYFLYRGRQWLGAVPAVAAIAAILVAVNTKPLKIEPVYDESAVEVALVEPAPPEEPAPAVTEPPPPPVETPPPPPPPVEEHAPCGRTTRGRPAAARTGRAQARAQA